MDGTWNDANGDGIFDHDTIPSDIELMVGRVDFADMPGGGASETDLLKRYLGKDHAFRHAQRRASARALIGDRAGDAGGEAFGASGFRTFSALLGPAKITSANVEDNAPINDRWISRLTAQDWLWVYGAGGGDVTLISGLGTHGQYNDVWSSDLAPRAKGTFYLLFGSWFVDWSQPDNIMRAALAAPDYGLTAAWSGRPHLYFQHMAVGEPAGYGIRLSQNNQTLYTNQKNAGTRGIHVALMGDPTLRMQVVAPPGAITVAPGEGAPGLSWGASADASAGYHVYRGSSEAGPFTRVTTTPLSTSRPRRAPTPISCAPSGAKLRAAALISISARACSPKQPSPTRRPAAIRPPGPAPTPTPARRAAPPAAVPPRAAEAAPRAFGLQAS
jgi:hypothetical protein